MADLIHSRSISQMKNTRRISPSLILEKKEFKESKESLESLENSPERLQYSRDHYSSLSKAYCNTYVMNYLTS